MTEPNKTLCPLCQIVIDHDDTYKAYRRKRKSKSTYPDWARVGDDGSLENHLVNFHRLPQKLAYIFSISFVLGEFMRKHPEMALGITDPKCGGKKLNVLPQSEDGNYACKRD